MEVTTNLNNKEWRAVHKDGEVIMLDEFSKTSHTFTKNPRLIAGSPEEFMAGIDSADLDIDWKAGVEYEEGDHVIYKDMLYRVVQGHTSQSDWTPDKVPALFKATLPEGEIGEWVQPEGSHDAYNTGDLVWYGSPDMVYMSLIDANVWSPEDYPAGWELQGAEDDEPEILEWKQPTGAHDAYQTGDQVLYNGRVWTSKIDANTTVPDGDEPYNRYWEPEE